MGGREIEWKGGISLAPTKRTTNRIGSKLTFIRLSMITNVSNPARGRRLTLLRVVYVNQRDSKWTNVTQQPMYVLLNYALQIFKGKFKRLLLLVFLSHLTLTKSTDQPSKATKWPKRKKTTQFFLSLSIWEKANIFMENHLIERMLIN